MTYVADACAIIALLRGEDGGDKMRDLLFDPSSEARMHAVNLGEVYYLALRRDADEAVKVMEQVRRLGIQVRRDLDDDFIRLVGKWKVGNRLAYADAFVLALAQRDNATVVTTDHGALDPVAAQGSISFLWLR